MDPTNELQILDVSKFPLKMEKALNENYLERYQATMVLAGVGDAVGYKNGQWEFCTSSKKIHAEFNEMTGNKGMNNFELKEQWKYSDDTAMHIATA